MLFDLFGGEYKSADTTCTSIRFKNVADIIKEQIPIPFPQKFLFAANRQGRLSQTQTWLLWSRISPFPNILTQKVVFL